MSYQIRCYLGQIFGYHRLMLGYMKKVKQMMVLRQCTYVRLRSCFTVMLCQCDAVLLSCCVALSLCPFC